ncbi:UvrABC system protein C [Alienimonas californiensis]|uniref:UvrABC system protein C n=2 Tax=Alienimonas californiensis TaxID=2527989 RepID=A0A517P7V6_9PLAN|nr:UvrABC system protein C [Alienimonas californiensis]
MWPDGPSAPARRPAVPRRLDPPHAVTDDAPRDPAEPASPAGATAGEVAAEAVGFEAARAKAKQLPTTPGVYLFKDAAGRVLYVGKAVNLRSRVGSYFLKAAAAERRTAELVTQIADLDHVDCTDEVDALLTEARLIKDIRPRYNSDLKDDKTFPYLQITTREDFPRVEFTREPRDKSVKLYGPFPSAGKLRGVINALQKVFKFRTCSLDIEADDERWEWFRPCLLHSIKQCTAPCNLRISKEEYARDIKRLKMVLEGKTHNLLREMNKEMAAAAEARDYERAGRLRDQIKAVENIDLRGDLDEHAQPEVFQIDPKKGLKGLQQVFKLPETPRVIEGVDIAHLQGGETVASLVQFIDGLPFKPGYKRYRIKTVAGVDDFASMREVVSRRLRRLQQEGGRFPDILLIDGGKGQLSAVVAAMEAIGLDETNRPFTISLAKREEEVFLPGDSEPKILSRHGYGLRLLQYVRDESHRFAQHYHHILRRKSTFDETVGSRKGGPKGRPRRRSAK